MLKPDTDQKRKTGKFYSVIILTVPRERMAFHMKPLGSTLVGQKVERMKLEGWKVMHCLYPALSLKLFAFSMRQKMTQCERFS